MDYVEVEAAATNATAEDTVEDDGSGGKARFHYCTSNDFGSLEAGFANSMSLMKANGPFNLASVYTTFRLEVANVDYGFELPVTLRSQGIDLSEVETLHFGFWVKTNGRNADRGAAACDVFGPVIGTDI